MGNLFLIFVTDTVEQHASADIGQQDQGDPGNEFFKGAEILDDGMDTDPSGQDRKSTRLNSSHITRSRMPSSA